MTDEHEYEYTKHVAWERDALNRLEYARYLAWERDALSRLYYGFWIVFLGGFVYSLHVRGCQHPHIILWTLVVFRVLAVLGTAINFFMQEQAVASLGHAGIAMLLISQIRMEAELKKDLDHSKVEKVNREQEKASKSDRCVARLESTLKVVGCAFLLAALGLSFLVYAPSFLVYAP